MKKIKFNHLLAVPGLLIVLQACHKTSVAPVHVIAADTTKKVVTPSAGLSIKLTTGLYVLNQGSTTTTGSLTFYDYNLKKLYPDLFYSVNNIHIGTGGSDMGIYGSRLYCTINNDTSGLISLNAHTGKLLEKTLFRGESLAFNKNNVIFGWSNALYELDTAKISTETNGTIVSGPVSMAVLNNKLYIVDQEIRGSAVLVTDLSSFKIIKTLVVGGIAGSCTADAFGNLYVIQNFFNVLTNNPGGGGITIIDYTADTVKSKLNGKAISGQIQIYAQGDFVYYPTADTEIAMYNGKTQTAVRDNFITDGTLLASPYAISGNPATGEIFISDIKDGVSNGMLYAFDNTGKLEYSFITGVNPVRMVLLN